MALQNQEEQHKTGRLVANLYGMIHPNASETATVRSLFIISPHEKVKLMITYPASGSEDAIKKFEKGVKVVKPYLRYTPQPDIS